MMNSKPLAAAIFLCALPSIGDTLQFKSGKIFECQVLSFEEGAFIVVVDGKKQQALVKNIYRIDFEVPPSSILNTNSLLSEPIQEIKGTGKWDLSTENSPIDDSQTITLRLIADEAVGSGFKKSRPVLVIRYKESKLEAYVAFNFFITTESTEVTTRIGNNAAETRQWSTSSDYEAVFYPGYVESFIQELSQANTLIVRLTPYGESPVTASFATAGLSEAAKPLLKAYKAR